MADVHVSTWLDYTEDGVTHVGLQNAVINATETTTIYLDNDIDLNDELPTGVTTSVKNTKTSVKIYINGLKLDGSNYKIKNIVSSANISVFDGHSSSKQITFNYVDIENAYVSGSAKLFNWCVFSYCHVSTEAFNTNIFDTGTSYFYYSGVYLKGSGTTTGTMYNADNKPRFYYCNIEGQGNFTKFALLLNNSYLSGDIKKVAGSGYINFANSYISVINATVETDAAPTAQSAVELLVNSDTFTLPEGASFPDTMIPLQTADLKSVQALRNVAFPI